MPNIYQTYDKYVEKAIKRLMEAFDNTPDNIELNLFCIKEEMKYNFRIGIITSNLDIKEWFRQNIRKTLSIILNVYNLYDLGENDLLIQNISTDVTEDFMREIDLNEKKQKQKYKENNDKNKCKCYILAGLITCTFFTGMFSYFMN